MTTERLDLIGFLQQEVDGFASMGHDVVLKRYVIANGHAPRDEALTPEEWDAVKDIALGRRFPIKQCFANSQRSLPLMFLSSQERDLPYVLIQGQQVAYVEGYVLDPHLFPIHHAWLEVNGKVVDLTLRRKRYRKRPVLQNRVVGTLDGMQYFGVTFGPEAIRLHVVKTLMWGTMLDDWELGHPVIRVWQEANPAVLSTPPDPEWQRRDDKFQDERERNG